MPKGASLIIKHVVRRYINLSDDTKCSLLKRLDLGLMYLTPALKNPVNSSFILAEIPLFPNITCIPLARFRHGLKINYWGAHSAGSVLTADPQCPAEVYSDCSNTPLSTQKHINGTSHERETCGKILGREHTTWGESMCTWSILSCPEKPLKAVRIYILKVPADKWPIEKKRSEDRRLLRGGDGEGRRGNGRRFDETGRDELQKNEAGSMCSR